MSSMDDVVAHAGCSQQVQGTGAVEIGHAAIPSLLTDPHWGGATNPSGSGQRRAAMARRSLQVASQTLQQTNRH
jgi:hypothetical protein